MERRYLVTALALVFALAAITPTLGAQSQSQRMLANSNFPVRTAKAAKRIAKRARTIAYGASRAPRPRPRQARMAAVKSADEAKANAAQATATAAQAKTSADATAAELAGLHARSDADAGTVTTDEENTFVDLGGPSVDVTVPASGLIEVWAQATISDGVVSLFEDGQQLPGQDPNGACSSLTDGLLSVQGIPELHHQHAGGVRVQRLRRARRPRVRSCSRPARASTPTTSATPIAACDPADAEFVDRTLTVAPRP